MSERYSFIGAEKACSGFPVRRGCMLLEVSTSGYLVTISILVGGLGEAVEAAVPRPCRVCPL